MYTCLSLDVCRRVCCSSQGPGHTYDVGRGGDERALEDEEWRGVGGCGGTVRSVDWGFRSERWSGLERSNLERPMVLENFPSFFLFSSFLSFFHPLSSYFGPSPSPRKSIEWRNVTYTWDNSRQDGQSQRAPLCRGYTVRTSSNPIRGPGVTSGHRTDRQLGGGVEGDEECELWRTQIDFVPPPTVNFPKTGLSLFPPPPPTSVPPLSLQLPPSFHLHPIFPLSAPPFRSIYKFSSRLTSLSLFRLP